MENILLRDFNINDIIIFSNGLPVKILELSGVTTCLTRNGIADMQFYKILYNNKIYFASNVGLLSKNPSIFNIVIANIGYRGYVDYTKFMKEYNIWKNILYRCYWHTSNIYQFYGGAGITVNPRWHCFELFLYDLINIRTYDTFKKSNHTYDLALSASSNCYTQGKVMLRPLYQTDVSEALDKVNSIGGGNINNTYIEKSSNINPKTIDYKPMEDGRYPYAAYEQLLKHPPQFLIPPNDDIGYNIERILNGIHVKNNNSSNK